MKNIKLDLTSRKGRHCVKPTEGVKRDTQCSILIEFPKSVQSFLITEVVVGKQIE